MLYSAGFASVSSEDDELPGCPFAYIVQAEIDTICAYCCWLGCCCCCGCARLSLGLFSKTSDEFQRYTSMIPECQLSPPNPAPGHPKIETCQVFMTCMHWIHPNRPQPFHVCLLQLGNNLWSGFWQLIGLHSNLQLCLWFKTILLTPQEMMRIHANQ